MEKKPAPTIDPQPAPVQQTAEVVMATSHIQSQVGRQNRLRALARTNSDIAWLISLAGAKFTEIQRPAAPAKGQKTSKRTDGAAENRPADVPESGDASGDYDTRGIKGT